MTPPRASTRYKNDHILRAWFAMEGEPSVPLFFQQTRFVSLPLREARIASTNALIGAATAPLYDVAQNRIEWAAGTAPAAIFLPCAGLPLLIGRGFNAFTLTGIFSKSSNVDDITPVTDQKLSSFVISGIGLAIFTNTLDTEEGVPFIESRLLLRSTSISQGLNMTSTVGGQLNSISLDITANPSDEVRLHAIWLEYKVA